MDTLLLVYMLQVVKCGAYARPLVCCHLLAVHLVLKGVCHCLQAQPSMTGPELAAPASIGSAPFSCPSVCGSTAQHQTVACLYETEGQVILTQYSVTHLLHKPHK